MARRKAVSQSLSSSLLVVVAIAVVAGFVGGFLFAKSRYVSRISEISKMNMEKATAIDSLNRELQVLGASTKEE